MENEDITVEPSKEEINEVFDRMEEILDRIIEARMLRWATKKKT